MMTYLVRAQTELALSAERVGAEDLVHDAEQLHDALVEPQVLAALHQVLVLLVVVTQYRHTLRLAH